tara:strand:- start:33 stop:743 length:711 start_codon:yes stop_codon:yes gene_type:complete
MKNFFINFKNKMHFQPHVLFIMHPFYFARRNLYKYYKIYSSKLRGDLIDIGCGSKPYKELFKHCKSYIGLEIENENGQNEADYFYDGNNFPFQNETFDSAICSEVLEHVFEPKIFLKEVHRILKKDGLIILTLPFFWDEHEQPYDYARYTSFGLKYILEQQNFEVVEQVKIGNNLSIIVQMINCYIYKRLYYKKNLLFKISSIVMFTIFNFFGVILSLLPKNEDMYLDNLVLAKKK